MRCKIIVMAVLCVAVAFSAGAQAQKIVITTPGAVVAGLHVFTFNQLQPAERWRRAALERTGIDQPRLAG